MAWLMMGAAWLSIWRLLQGALPGLLAAACVQGMQAPQPVQHSITEATIPHLLAAHTECTVRRTVCVMSALCCTVFLLSVSGMVLLGSRSASVQHPSSPAGTSLGKKRTRPVAASSRSSLSSAPQHGCYATGDPIRPDTVTDSNTGRKVLVYWPADQQWWEATLCWVSGADWALQRGRGVLIQSVDVCI
jgi:hypothetical protein